MGSKRTTDGWLFMGAKWFRQGNDKVEFKQVRYNLKSSKKNLTTKNKSVILALKAKNLLNDSLLVCINNLTLEDLIAIKLELSCNLINNRLYGFDI